MPVALARTCRNRGAAFLVAPRAGTAAALSGQSWVRTVVLIRRLHRNLLLRAHTCRFGTGFLVPVTRGVAPSTAEVLQFPENLRICFPADPRAPSSARAHHRCVHSIGAGTGSRPLPPTRRFVVLMVATSVIQPFRNALAFSTPDPGHPVRMLRANPPPHAAESTARAAQHIHSRHQG